MKKALITGEDGNYMADFLLYKGYQVHSLYLRNLDAKRD
jgi:GDP-D-mannose dehydratase